MAKKNLNWIWIIVIIVALIIGTIGGYMIKKTIIYNVALPNSGNVQTMDEFRSRMVQSPNDLCSTISKVSCTYRVINPIYGVQNPIENTSIPEQFNIQCICKI